MIYQVWTPSDIKARCIEAAETLRTMPGSVGPSVSLTYWPEYRDEYTRGEPTRVNRDLPTRSAISRLWEFVSWVNSELSESERKFLYQYGRVMVSPNRTLRGYCQKIGLKEHTYRRRIAKIFQKLADNRNINQEVRYDQGVDDDPKIEDQAVSSSDERSPNFIRFAESRDIPLAPHALRKLSPARSLLNRARNGA